jgi:hypothetical protein
MHDDCPGRSKPRFQGWDSGEIVSLPHHDVGARLQQVLLHVVPEVVEEFDLLLQGGGELPQGVVVLKTLVVDVVNVAVKGRKS